MVILIMFIFGHGVSTVKAELTLSLAAESADLDHLAVGQAVRFDVILSGLAPGDALAYLAGTVTFPGGLLGTPTDVAAGAIVPDPTGFVGAGFDGAADAFYDAVFFSTTNTPITSNGVFYSFEVVVLQVGSGVLSFDVSSLAAADGSNDPVSLAAGPDLPFTVVRAVPEPASLGMAMLGILAVAGGSRMNSRRGLLRSP
ncbi:PEP-CTERM sorting domain-containing protein [Aquisphaera insulae]|uniref:PEP-CTERM sorting domain-containing protein n=1 Tax=Aquisphaera insulae TaxID=2712864 RepID=UPI0013EC95F8|nr:PEP-CTERM sorting domain-containing protein [Aquisphaera insulae]